MENKNFDVNKLIGFVILSALLITFFYINKPEKNTNPKQENLTEKNADVASEENLLTTKVDILTNDSINTNVEKFFTLENDKLFIKISSVGGQIKEVLLKEEYAYDDVTKHHKRALYFIKENAKINIQLGVNGQQIYTENLKFDAVKNEKEIVLTSNLGGGQLQFKYSLGADYQLDFDIESKGLNLSSQDSKIPLDYDFNAFALEKGRTQEQTYNSSVYRLKEDQDVDSGPLFGSDWEEEETLDWVAFKQQFFGSILHNDKGFVDSKMIIENVKDKESKFIKTFAFKAHLLSENGDLKQSMKWTFVPLKLDLLKSLGNDYKELIPFGWSIIGWLNEYVFYNIFKIFGEMGINFGIVILLMTVVVKLLLSPVQYKQFKQSAMMRVLKPDIDKINEKYKDKKKDGVKKQQEVMGLYNKAGVNPLAGCVPALLQVPIFYALFRFFPNMFALRGKSFLWAEDLTAYDSVFEWTTNIPVLSSFYGNHVSLFALLYCILLLLYTRMTSNNLTQQPAQEGMPDMRFLMYMMPVMFIFFLNSYASGLSWYYVVSNFINIGLILVIKNFLIDEDKLHVLVQENKLKPKKTGKFRQKIQKMMDQAQQQKDQNENRQSNRK